MKAGSYRTASIALLVLGILIAGAVAIVLLMSRPAPIVRAEIGTEIPDAQRKMQTLDGGEVTFSQLKGNTVVVNFWASWCRPCIKEFPLFADALESREVRIVGVVYDDSAEAARDFSKRLGASWPSVVDSDERIARMFGVSTPPGIPQSFFIDKQGILRSRVFGEINSERLDAELNRMDQ